METRLATLQGEARELLKQAEAIRAKYPGTETWSQEDVKSFDDMMDAYDEKMASVEREKRAAEARRRSTEPAEPLVLPSADGAPGVGEDVIAQAQKAWKSFLRFGEKSLRPQDYDAMMKAFQADSDTEGGYLVAPQQFVNDLIQAVDDMVLIRGYATVIQVPKAESLGVPTLDTDAADADWTSELATGSEETTLRIGKRELFPHPLAKRFKMSRKLMRAATIDPETLIRQRLAYKFGVTMEKGFLTGNGSGQPLGVFTASNDGVPTTRDVVTGNATNVTADGWIDFIYSMKPQYWSRMRIIMHRDVLRNTRKLKDGSGDYIWRSGLAGNTAPTILDIPYDLSEFAPNTFTNGNYAAVVGDFSFYWIAEALSYQLQVLNELYAETNQIGYIARTEVDGMPVLSEAFARLKFAAS